MSDEEITTLEVAGKKYKIPTVTIRQLKAAVKCISFENPMELKDEDYLDGVIGFYHLLLKAEYPELTKKKLEDMPAYQTGIEYVTMVKVAAMQRPLDSGTKGKAKKPPSKSS